LISTPNLSHKPESYLLEGLPVNFAQGPASKARVVLRSI
jgi:hypothetical protein